MGQNKLKKFAECKTFDFLFQPQYEDLKEKGFELKGKWNQEFFKNDHPIILEIGCGRGEYTVGLAKNHPENNYIGLDLKGYRLWRGCKNSIEAGLTNIAFLRSLVQNSEYLFGEGEVSELWIPHPDPQPTNRRRNKRLTAEPFLRRYANILKPDATIHLKTDDTDLYQFTLEVIEEGGHILVDHVPDLYKTNKFQEYRAIETYFEHLFVEQGRTIKYIQFKLNPALYASR
jgi:tRNA (guanine-N7-)-methyltransferase